MSLTTWSGLFMTPRGLFAPSLARGNGKQTTCGRLGQIEAVWIDSARRFQPIETAEAIDRNRNQPAAGEDGDDQITEAAEMVVEPADEGPERSLEIHAVGDETERFDTADQHRDQH